MRKLHVAGFLFVLLAVVLMSRAGRGPLVLHPGAVTAIVYSGTAGTWFQGMKPYCNPVEVETQHRWNPPPEGMEGTAYSAACYALAGKVDRARELILELDDDHQWRAAGIVFNVAHPVADAGDDRSAGPIMEMVVEFWPNHHMALYHAGMSAYVLDRPDAARDYLEQFLQFYNRDDGWVHNANAVLEELGGS
jgi:hypothetical protein